MPLRNRATPQQEVIAHPARGLVYANRGVLVNAHGEIRRRWGVRRWIACRLEFKGRRRRPLMAPGRFTELFFLDEATAFAAAFLAGAAYPPIGSVSPVHLCSRRVGSAT